MPGLDLAQFALVTLVMAAASIVQLAAGVGAALVGAPLLLAIEPRLVPAAFSAAMMVLLFGQWRSNAGSVPPGLLLPAVAGVVLGTGIGMALAVAWPGLASRRGCGVVILAAAALTLLAPQVAPRGRVLALAGLVSGVMGGLAAVHGPLVGLAVSRLRPEAARGFLGLFWLIAQGTLLLMAVPAGRADWGTPLLALLLLPGLALGAALSGPAQRWLVGPRLRAGILGLALVTGGLLVVAG
ncbi:TSUP family transporter [Muricoccus aerilatus]|uniref:TSUP family transporter n=1 Tax=Muricoccus aerilatus TaxID=452982 RepID=UPI000A5E4934|nr:TSUP family transporter [Roseomonas aerilata]